jgi:hypothetical protein
MGVGIPGEASLPVEGDLGNEEGGEEEDAVEEEEELSVHHTASTGDVEVCQRSQFWNLIALFSCMFLVTFLFRLHCTGTSIISH